MPISAGDLAKWMLRQLEESRSKELDPQDAAVRIRKEFGEEFLHANAHGGTSIDKQVLASFRKLTSGTVVWDSRGFWRKRTPNDPACRRQV